MILKLSDIKKQATHRPEGYYNEVVSKGRIRGRNLILSKQMYIQLCMKYRGTLPPKSSKAKRKSRFLDSRYKNVVRKIEGLKGETEEEKWIKSISIQIQGLVDRTTACRKKYHMRSLLQRWKEYVLKF